MIEQLPRRSLAWLLFAFALAVAPHLMRLPVWVIVVLGVAVAWRYRVHQGLWSFPSRTVKLLLVTMAFIAVGLQWRTLTGLEPAVALLAIAGALKSMETRTTRDFMVVVFVAWFLVASSLLFEQEVPWALYALLATTGITAAVVARNQGEAAPGFPRPLALGATMLAQALPIMLLMFVVFPRIAPLWSIPQAGATARTGPGDNMAPGDVARLSASNDLAFRATFDGPVPASRELYWRGLVFSEFDGRQWRQGAISRQEAALAEQGAVRPAIRKVTQLPGNAMSDYEVILEATNQPWIYVIGFPVSFDQNLRLGSDYRLMSPRPLAQRLRYRVRSDLAAVLEPELGVLRRRAELQLPEGFNPRALAQARTWRAAEESDAAYVERVLDWFRSGGFVYTLSPPLLGRDTVDEFLFGERRGFCEHYASAFAVLLRAAAIPARVVVGYQGGERNPYQGYLLVHQYDAHAWVEAWLEGRGWVRIDPTAAVSPDRIEAGASGALGEEFLADAPLAMERYRNVRLIGWMRLRWDTFTYQWARFVLNYDSERQVALLARVAGGISAVHLVMLLLGCGALALLLVAASLFGVRPRRRHDAATAAYLKLCAKLAERGLGRLRGEGPLDYACRLARQRPEMAAELQALTADFVALGFGNSTGQERERMLHSLRRGVRRFRAR